MKTIMKDYETPIDLNPGTIYWDEEAGKRFVHIGSRWNHDGQIYTIWFAYVDGDNTPDDDGICMMGFTKAEAQQWHRFYFTNDFFGMDH